jgi:hypothetical protein
MSLRRQFRYVINGFRALMVFEGALPELYTSARAPKSRTQIESMVIQPPMPSTQFSTRPER